MEYSNDLQKMLIFVGVVWHIMTLFIIFFGNLAEELYGYIIVVIIFVTSILLLDILFYINRHLWYFTYFKDEKIEQRKEKTVAA